MGREEYGEGKGTAHDPKPPHHLSDMVETVLWTCMAVNGAGSAVFIDDVTADRSRMNSEVFRSILSAQIQPNAVKVRERCFTVFIDNVKRKITSLYKNG